MFSYNTKTRQLYTFTLLLLTNVNSTAMAGVVGTYFVNDVWNFFMDFALTFGWVTHCKDSNNSLVMSNRNLRRQETLCKNYLYKKKYTF